MFFGGKMIDVNYDIFEMKEFRYAPRYAYLFLTPAHLERLKVISEEMTRFAETAEIMHNSLTPDFNALMSISREIDVSHQPMFFRGTDLSKLSIQLREIFFLFSCFNT